MLYVKKALPKRVGPELKQKLPLYMLRECSECDKTRRCRLVGEQWLCEEHMPPELRR